MALPPTIPTSFVPRQSSVTSSQRARRSGVNIFLYVSLGLLGLAVVGSIAAFGYAYYLTDIRDANAAQLAAAQKNINANTVEQFIRLRDRLTAGKSLVANHVELSQFFDVLEQVTLTSVRFDTLKIVVADDRSATVELAGSARNFNALAAQSAAITNQPLVKRAIFSGFTVTKDGSVNFTLDADLDPKLVKIAAKGQGSGAQVVAPIAPAATGTAPAANPLPATTSKAAAATLPSPSAAPITPSAAPSL